jgi:hypothetical protein
MSHEQSLQLGDYEWMLNDPTPEVAQLVDEVAAQRKKADQQADDLIKDTFLQSADHDPVHARFKALGERMTQAPFVKYAETFVNLMADKTRPAVAEADRQLRSLEDQVVIDVGSGRNPKILQEFLAQYNIKAYLGIDTHARFDQGREVSRLAEFGEVMYLDKQAGDLVDGALIRGDMLSVLSRLPDESVSLAFCGIDSYIVNPATPYGARLAEEAVRVQSPDGLIFGIQGIRITNGILNVLEARSDFKNVGPIIPGLSFLKKRK